MHKHSQMRIANTNSSASALRAVPSVSAWALALPSPTLAAGAVTDDYPDRLSQRRVRDPDADTTLGWDGVAPSFPGFGGRHGRGIAGLEKPGRRTPGDS